MIRHPSISVIVPNLNEMCILPDAIASIWQALERVAQSADGELIVVDNGSTDGSLEWLRGLASAGKVRLVEAPGVTVGELRNRGAALARGSIFSFIDADCVVDENYYRSALPLISQSGIGAAGARYEIPEDASLVESTWHRMHARRRSGDVNYLNACNLLVKCSVFEEIGGFSEKLETGEDAELCQRILAHGYRLREEPRMKVVHLGSAKTWTQFVKKEAWRATGMFGTWHGFKNPDKPILMTVLNALLACTGIGVLVVRRPLSLSVILFAISLMFVVPASAVLYRFIQVRAVKRPVTAVVLYFLYFWARFYALLKLGGKRLLEAR